MFAIGLFTSSSMAESADLPPEGGKGTESIAPTAAPPSAAAAPAPASTLQDEPPDVLPPASTPAAVPKKNGSSQTKESPPDPDQAERKSVYSLSIRPTGGVGAGNLGVGGRLGVAGEYWLTDVLGIGFEGGELSQVSGAFLGPGTSGVASFIAPVVGVRGAPRGNYPFATFGMGYANVRRTETGGLCFDFGGGGCPPAKVTRYDGYAVSVAAGWLAHPGASFFEIGPVVRLDVMGDFQGNVRADCLFTVNLELGFALLGR